MGDPWVLALRRRKGELSELGGGAQGSQAMRDPKGGDLHYR